MVTSRSLYLVLEVIEIILHFVTVKQCLLKSIGRELFYPVKKIEIVEKANMGPSIKDVGIFLSVFYTPLPHVKILTLIYLTSTF